MISERYITEWSAQAGWSSVEQELLLSRLIVEIANDRSG
jgi:hypothetical protein